MPLNTHSLQRSESGRDSPIDPVAPEQAALREEAEARVSLARIIQLDDLSRQSIPLRSVWRQLATGVWRARNSFQTDSRFYFVLEPRVEGASTPRPAAKHVNMLLRALLSERQKVMAFDSNSSHSTIATRLASCLKTMGFLPRASRVPALLVAVAAAEQGHTQVCDARCTITEQDGVSQVIVSTPRLDSFLSSRLTREEFKVARLFVEGLSYAEIAALRNSAVRTVANHIASIFRKVRVSGRAELLLFLALNARSAVAIAGRDTGSGGLAEKRGAPPPLAKVLGGARDEAASGEDEQTSSND